LTAAQMNALQANDYNQTVSTKTASYTLVAADKGTKIVMNSASATTITVNTSLFSAGDTLTILNISTGVCTITAGTATVSTTGSLALAQFGSGTLYFTSAGVSVFQANGVAEAASGLTLITTQVIGTTVASVTISSCFSSTYDNYKITINGGVGTGTINLRMVLGATTTGYYYVDMYRTYANTDYSTGYANQALFGNVGGGSVNALAMNVEIGSPNLAKRTTISSPTNVPATDAGAGILAGYLDNNTQYTAFTLSPSSGTLTGGTIRVYGYQNS